MTFRFAEYTSILPFLRSRRNAFFELVPDVADGLDSSSAVLDVGCGDGRIASLLSRRTKCNILAIDESEDAVAATRKTIADSDQNKLVQIEKTSWSDLTDCLYDKILSIHLLYHIDKSEWPDYIERMLNMLRPGGKLIIITTSSRAELHNMFAASRVIKNLVIARPSLENAYGNYIFGEDVENSISKKFNLKSYFTRFPIRCPPEWSRTAIYQQSDLCYQAWIKFFSFMYRLPPQTIMTEFGFILRERILRANMELQIEGRDVVHVIHKP